MAGTSHFEYSSNERGLRVMCSARMDTDFIYEAYRLGAGAVLFSGCHPQDCHYITGQPIGERRAERMLRAFERMGMTPGRFRIEWISAAEGDRYQQVINEMQDLLDGIPMEELVQEIEKLRPQMERRARRMREVPLVDEALAYASELEAVVVAQAALVSEEA
jgi:coenzyme F420-reducing hydrogenase delta subunit